MYDILWELRWLSDLKMSHIIFTVCLQLISFLKLFFLLQNKSYKKSRSHCALCMRLYARKIPLIVLLFMRPAKKQDKSIKLVFFEISIFISKQRFLLFLKLFFVFSAYS